MRTFVFINMVIHKHTKNVQFSRARSSAKCAHDFRTGARKKNERPNLQNADVISTWLCTVTRTCLVTAGVCKPDVYSMSALMICTGMCSSARTCLRIGRMYGRHDKLDSPVVRSCPCDGLSIDGQISMSEATFRDEVVRKLCYSQANDNCFYRQTSSRSGPDSIIMLMTAKFCGNPTYGFTYHIWQYHVLASNNEYRWVVNIFVYCLSRNVLTYILTLCHWNVLF